MNFTKLLLGHSEVHGERRVVQLRVGVSDLADSRERSETSTRRRQCRDARHSFDWPRKHPTTRRVGAPELVDVFRNPAQRSCRVRRSVAMEAGRMRYVVAEAAHRLVATHGTLPFKQPLVPRPGQQATDAQRQRMALAVPRDQDVFALDPPIQVIKRRSTDHLCASVPNDSYVSLVESEEA